MEHREAAAAISSKAGGFLARLCPLSARLRRLLCNNRSWRPVFAEKRCNLYAINYSPSQAWIEIAHRPLIEINDATRRQRPHIIYLYDGLFACTLNEGIFRSRTILNPAKFVPQIGFDGSCPRGGIIALP